MIDDLKSIDSWDPRGIRIYGTADVVTSEQFSSTAFWAMLISILGQVDLPKTDSVYIAATEGDSEAADGSKILCEKINCDGDLKIYSGGSNIHGTKYVL